MSKIKQQDLPFFDQKTIECDLAMFTRLLNDLVERVNFNHKYIVELYDTVAELKQRIGCLEKVVAEHEQRITELEKDMGVVKGDITNINQELNSINNNIKNIKNTITELESKLAWYDSHLPAEKSWIDEKHHKLAVGNINVMSANGGTPTTNIGIVTSKTIRNDNDIYFN